LDERKVALEADVTRTKAAEDAARSELFALLGVVEDV
jgi:hypothetical protein